MSSKKRDYSLDVIRIVALLGVLSVHFFYTNYFYKVPIAGKRMYVMVIIRSFFMTCVPLFITLTGYLMSSKVLSKKYYLGIVKTLSIYVLASIACILYGYKQNPEQFTLKNDFFAILNFKAAPYAWYVEMYIGLFLLIPFINLIYNGLKDRKQKRILIITFLILTSIGPVLNIYDFYTAGWWRDPGISNNYQKLVPNWWEGIFPLTFYFIGCYLKEYELTISKKISFILLVTTVLLTGSFNFYRSHNVRFQWGNWQEWQSILIVIITVLVFRIIVRTKWINNMPNALKKGLKLLSDLSFGAYLVSYICDQHFYSKLIARVPSVTDRMMYYFIMIPIIFCCSMVISAVLNLIYTAIYHLVSGIVAMIKKKNM